MRQYKEAPEFRELKPNTRKSYLQAIDYLKPLDPHRVKDLKRRHFLRIRDKLQEVPAAANKVIHVSSILMRFAVDRDWRETNPVMQVRPLKGGEFRRWKESEIYYALEMLPERFRRALVLALYSGQREGDCAAMNWSDYDGEGITVKQEKTGEPLWIPCHSALKAELDCWKEDASAETILTNARGQPWKASSFATVFWREIGKHQDLDGCVFHGLRKSAAARLAEAGCTTHEIASVTGHRTLQMLAHYSREAEQKLRAKSAIGKLEKARGKNK